MVKNYKQNLHVIKIKTSQSFPNGVFLAKNGTLLNSKLYPKLQNQQNYGLYQKYFYTQH